MDSHTDETPAKIDQLSQWVGYMNSKVQAIDNATTNIRDDVKSARTEVAKLEIKLESSIDKVEKKLESNSRDLGDKIDKMADKLYPFMYKVLGGLALLMALASYLWPKVQAIKP
jgi:outer membrane murein-binding lipoprotein Lpp